MSEEDKSEAKADQAAAYDQEQQAIARQLHHELLEKMEGLLKTGRVDRHAIATALLGAACTVAQSYMTAPEFATWLAGIAESHAVSGADPKALN